MKRAFAFLALLALAGGLFAPAASAQNPQCPTRPAGDSSNACASTAFVTGAVAGPIPWSAITGTPTTLAGYGITDAPFKPGAVISKGGSVQVGPYPVVASGVGNFGPTGGSTALEFVTVGQLYRARQSGTITSFKISLSATTGITGIYLKIWRQNFAIASSNFDLVGASGNVASGLTIGTNTFTVSIPGVQVGDYIGARIEYSGGASVHNFYASSQANTTNDNVATVVYSVLNATPSTSNYNWGAQTATSGVAVIEEIFMQAPIFVSIGDSITSGLQSSTSFADNYEVSPNIYNSYSAVLAGMLGYAYQNVGIGGDTSTGVAARFASDVVAKNPTYAIIMIGVNDILNGVTNTTIVANYTSILSAAQSAGIKPIVIGVLPFRGYSSATNAMLQQRDLLNAQLVTLAATYGGLYVSPDNLGTYYAGGDADNKWNLSWSLDDGLHPSPAGYAWLGTLIYDALIKSSISNVAGLNDNVNAQAFLTNTSYGVNSFPINQTGYRNTSFGANVLRYNTIGFANTAVGFTALRTNGLNGAAGNYNSAVGYAALYANIGGTNNSAFGSQVLNANVSGNYNTAVGDSALTVNVSGNYNVAVGASVLALNTASQNTGVGYGVLQSNVSGANNAAFGYFAAHVNTAPSISAFGSGSLQANTSGASNSAFGFNAMSINTTGSSNVAFGSSVLSHNTTGAHNSGFGASALLNGNGDDNDAFGFQALSSNAGTNNSAFGSNALVNNTSGNYNNAFGFSTLGANVSGSQNSAFGWEALMNSTADSQNIALGARSLVNVNGGSNNIGIGISAGAGIVTGSNNVIIGSVTGLSPTLSNSIILGDGAGTIRADYNKTTASTWTFGAASTFIAALTNTGITTDTTHTDASVCEDTTTHQFYFGSGAAGICLGTSSARFKHDLAPLHAGLDQIMALQPVSYKLNSDHGDPDHTLYGFTAEQGGLVLPDLVGRDTEGRPNTFDYLGVVPVLVKAIQEQQAEIADLKRRMH